MKARITEKLNTIIKEAKRPFVCLLVLCLVVTLIPVAGIDILPLTETFADTEVAELPFEGSQCTISANTVLTAEQTIGSNKVITINAGCTLKIQQKLVLEENVIITGGGILDIAGSDNYVKIYGDHVRFGNITITSTWQGGRQASLIISYLDQSDVEVTMDSVVITDSAISDTNNLPSVFLFNYPGKNHILRLKGETRIANNLGGKVGAIGYSFTNSVDKTCKVYVQDSVQICGNKNGSGADANIKAVNTDMINISGNLTADANIGITPADYSSNFAALSNVDDNQTAKERARNAFFIDDFHNYGVEIVGNNLKPVAKTAMSFNVTGNGSFHATDARGRNIISASSGLTDITYTVKEVSGRNVNLNFIPDTDNFVRAVTLGGTNAIAALDTYDDINKSTTTAIVYSGTNAAIFEQAVTSVDLNGIIAPSGFMEAEDSLEHAAIGLCTPASASLTLVDKAWYSSSGGNMTLMGGTEKFVQDQHYILVATLSAVGGSQFAPTVAVSAAGISANCTASGSPALTTLSVSIEYTATKMLLSLAETLGYVTFTTNATAGNATYDGQPHGPIITMTDINGGTVDTVSSTVTVSGAATYSVTTASGAGNTVISTITINGPTAAGSYTAEADIGNTIYEGTHTFTGLSYTIAKKTITPTSIDGIASATKHYDGTTAVTVGAILFSGLVGSDSLTKGTDYTATIAFENPNVGNRAVTTDNIDLQNTAMANNYVLSTNTLSQDGARILKVTPQAVEPGAVSFAAVNATGRTIADVGLNVASWFTNTFNTALHVGGMLQIVSPASINTSVDPATATQLDDSTPIQRNHEYTWMFTPSEQTNYYNAFGSVILWPAEPIASINLTGITFPEAGVVNNTTISGITATCGPTDSSSVTITSISIFEIQPDAAQRPFNYGDTFKYNRQYYYSINFETGEGDRFVTTPGGLTVRMTSGNAAHVFTQNTVTATTARYTFPSLPTAKGTLDSSYFTFAPKEYVYDGNLHPITFSAITKTAIDTINDALLKYKTALYDNSYGSEGELKGYTDITMIAGINSELPVKVKVSHPDYSPEWVDLIPSTMKITPKPITNVTISEVIQKPYDGTDEVEVVLTSSDIVAGDVGNVTFSAVAHISNPNVTSDTVTVTAESIQLGGSRAFNYVLSPAAMTVTTTGSLNTIQKVTPTGGSITFAAVTTAYPQYSQLNVSPQGFVNEYITGANGVAGTIVSYVDSGYGTTVGAAQLNTTLVKRHPYYWKFFPTDSTNYNVVEGGPVQYWPGAPITNATLTGIVLPVATANPTAQNQISLELNDPTANITVSAISWNETSDIEGVSDRAIGPADTFYYNRYHILTITLSAVGEGGAAPVDEFNDEAAMLIPTFAGIINIGGQLQPCVTEIVKTNGKAYTAVITCSFGGVKTDKGTLTNDNLDARDFASYYRDGTLYKNDLRGEGNLLTYVYTGRRVGPYPKSVSLQAVDIQSIKYSTGGGLFNEEVPLYSEVMSNGQPKDIQIQLTHPDYNGTIEKDVQLYIGPCYVRAEGVIYGGKYYDGTKDIDANVAKILWAPTLAQSSTNEGITSEEIGRLITYDAQYEFGDERAGSAKDVYVSNIHFISTNFLPQYANIPEKGIGDAVGNQVNGSFTYHSSAPSATPIPISKAAVTPKTGSILKQPINSAVSLSAVYTDYIINHSNASTGAVMVNAVRSSLDVHGSLDFMSGGAIMSYADMDSATLVQGQAYTWCFTPTDAVNYAVTTGTQILWPFPPPTPSYGGGGGGGGAAAPTKAAVSTLSGVIATPGSFSTQIHVYWASGGSIVTDKAFLARVTGAAVDRALTAMPDGNIVVDRDGNIIVKAIIEGGMLKAYLTGDNYLTVQRRNVDYIDVPGHWFEPYVDFCSARDIMNGTGESKFSPNDTLTRAMAATIIYRLEGALALDGSERHFADVEDGKWYSDGIAWAGGNGIVNGIGIKNFAPHWDITREQLAVMIYNYCRTRCGAEAVPSGYFDARLYNDGGQIASWAQEAVAYCSKVGLMKGNDKGEFCPKDTATRAEFATITQRLIEAFLDGKL